MSESRRVWTEAELDAALGELTSEEKAALNDPAMYTPPTEEELARLGPNFVGRVLKLAWERRITENIEQVREYMRKHQHCPEYLHPERYMNFQTGKWGEMISHVPVNEFMRPGQAT